MNEIYIALPFLQFVVSLFLNDIHDIIDRYLSDQFPLFINYRRRQQVAILKFRCDVYRRAI